MGAGAVRHAIGLDRRGTTDILQASLRRRERMDRHRTPRDRRRCSSDSRPGGLGTGCAEREETSMKLSKAETGFVKAQGVARFATVDSDRIPHNVPVCPLMDGPKIYIA